MPTGTVPLVFDTATVVVRPLKRLVVMLTLVARMSGAVLGSSDRDCCDSTTRIVEPGNAEQGAALAYASDHHRSAVGIAHVFIWVAITLSIVIRLSEIALRL